MKFNNGYWLLRPGMTAHLAAETMDVRTTESTVSVAALTRPHVDRGSHLNTATISVELSSPAENVVGVSVRHLLQPDPARTHFEVRDTHPTVEIVHDDHAVSLSSGALTAAISTHGPWSLSFGADDRALTSATARSTGSIDDDHDIRHMIQRLELPVGANVYGFGERFTAFVKNGQVVDTWNEDGGTASEQAYKSIPFFVTDAGFGIFVNSPARVSFEVGSEVVSSVQFSVPGNVLDYYVIYGPTPKAILERYTGLTGRPALPPQWSFGLWLSTSFTTEYDEATVTSFVDGMAEREIPLSVFHFDCYWMKPLNWCDFEWDPDVFPDPAAMLARFAERGLHTSIWINPYLGQRAPLFAEAESKGYLLRRPDGGVWQSDLWVAGMAIIDFTNPEAAEWFAAKVRGLLQAGVHAIKTDFGERIPTDVAWHDGSDPQLMHNSYPLLYNRIVFEAVESVRGTGEAVLFARSATVGSQSFPVHWGGDCESSYPSMAESLRGGLSLGMSGFGFWSHDIGGFEGTPSATLFTRWLQFGLLSSHARLHGSTSYRVPWAFGDEAVRVARDFTRMRMTMMPYLWNAAVEANATGIPVMRSMLLEFPEDRTSSMLDRQYMLGADLLVAPVFSDAGAVEYYLPAGEWIGFLDGQPRSGGRWLNEVYAVDALPLLARPGAVIPIGAVQDRPDYDYVAGVTLEVFGLADGASTAVSVSDSTAATVAEFEVRRTGDTVTATVLSGANRLGQGWSVRWVTGPLGGNRGPLASASSAESSLSLQVA